MVAKERAPTSTPIPKHTCAHTCTCTCTPVECTYVITLLSNFIIEAFSLTDTSRKLDPPGNHYGFYSCHLNTTNPHGRTQVTNLAHRQNCKGLHILWRNPLTYIGFLAVAAYQLAYQIASTREYASPNRFQDWLTMLMSTFADICV